MTDEDAGAYEHQHRAIQEEYRKQAPSWATGEISAHLRWVVDNLALRPHSVVLDVAAGTGLLGRAIAPHVGRVVASDITAEMLAAGREAALQTEATNIDFERGPAEDLPYPAASFDMVVTRFSVHHFLHPGVVVAEMERVCRPGGQVVVIDLTSPEDEELAARYNELERLRDGTHTRALSARELDKLVADAGLEVTNRYSREVEMDADGWMEATRLGPTERGRILAAVSGELDGSGEKTGLRPFVRDGELMFTHLWEMVVARKPPR